MLCQGIALIGYVVRTYTIPAEITPKNRLLIGAPRKSRNTVGRSGFLRRSRLIRSVRCWRRSCRPCQHGGACPFSATPLSGSPNDSP
jgi:hypothetical protein